MKPLIDISFELRKKVVELISSSKCGHIGGDLSVMDILVMLYFKYLNIDITNINNPNRDRLILSKGHCVESLYLVLAKRGFIDEDELFSSYARFKSPYIGHPTNKIPGIEVCSGSLGHGLSLGVGMALACRLDSRCNRIYVVMGDGESAEGSVWEAAMAASHYRLDNLCCVIDRNHLQISGNTDEIMSQEPMIDRWKSFGWYVLVCNGNSMKDLDQCFHDACLNKGYPTIIIANTVKGFGSELIENKAEWHHKVPNKEELEAIIFELKQRKRSLI